MKNFVVGIWIFAFGQILFLLLSKELKMGIIIVSLVFFSLWAFVTKTKQFRYEQF